MHVALNSRQDRPINELKVTLCSQCHPYFTGAQKFVDTAGRIEKFQKRYEKGAEKQATADAQSAAATATKAKAIGKATGKTTSKATAKKKK